MFGNDGNASTKSRRERQPLHLALTISPLYLLVSSQLMKSAIGRENVICVGTLPLDLVARFSNPCL